MKPPSRIATAVAGVGAVSFTYQRIAEARDRRRFPPPGRLVDIGGRRLHLVTAGEGSPAVVIIPALAEPVLPGCTFSRLPPPGRRPAFTTGLRPDGATRRLAGGGHLISWPPICTLC